MDPPYHQFPDYTTTHGVGHIKRVQKPVGRIIWAVLTLSGVGAALWQITMLFQQYLRHDYHVKYDIRNYRPQSFPAVMFCNLNPHRLSKVEELLRTTDVYDLMFEPFINSTSLMYDYSSVTELQSSMTMYEGRQELGHQLTDMLIHCNYGPFQCDISNFTYTYNYAYGNCYTYNGDITEANRLSTNRAGPIHGLTVTLFTQINEYIPALARANGFRVVVHDQNQVPFPEEQGFQISPGFQTQIGLKRFEMQRLGDPYDHCHPSDTAGDLNLYHTQHPNSYSSSVCLHSCYQLAVIEQCNCYDDEIPTTEGYSGPPCHMDKENFDCRNSLYMKYFDDSSINIDDLCPDCFPLCKEIGFYGSHSQAMFPVPKGVFMEEYIQLLRAEHLAFNEWFGSMEAKHYTKQMLNQEVSYALAQAQIFFDELNYEIVYQKPMYTPTDVISNLGGQLGLWIGMSILSVFEYFELIGRLIVYCCCKRKSHAEQKNKDIGDFKNSNDVHVIQMT